MFAIRTRSHLVVVDVQDRIARTIHDAESAMGNIARLVRYAHLLDMPITFTEHMADGIGTVLPALRARFAGRRSCRHAGDDRL